MRLSKARTNRFSLSGLLIVSCTFFASVSSPVSAQRLLTEDEIVEAVHQIVFRGRDIQTVREDLRKLAELKLNQIETFCSLTGEQRRKLELAASGDRTRFLHEVSHLERQSGKQLGGKQVGPDELAGLFQACGSLNSRLQDGLYRKDSLFEKVRDSILSENQIQKLEAIFDFKIRHRANLLTPLIAE